jgi:DHA1 family tetracycline resistance protein-like MFS transporter
MAMNFGRLARWTRWSPDLKRLAVSTGIWGLGFGLYGTLWPLYVERLGGNAQSIGWLETGAAIITAAVALPGGWWADRTDRRRLMIWGSVIATPAPLLYLWAPNWHWLFLGLVLYFGSSVASPATQAYIQEQAGENLAVTYSVVTGAFSAGAVAGPAIGGYLVSRFSYHPVFALAFLLYGISTWLLVPLKPAPSQAERRPSRTVPRWPTGRPRFYQWAGLAAVLTFAASLAGPYVVPFWRSVGHLSIETIGFIGALSTLVGALTGPLWGALAERWGLPEAVAAGLGVSGLGLAGLWTLPRMVSAQAVAALLRGLGSSASTLMGVAIGRVVPYVEAGSAYGLMGWMTQVAAALAPYPGALLYQFRPEAPMVFTTALWTLVIVFILTRPPSHPAALNGGLGGFRETRLGRRGGLGRPRWKSMTDG